MSDLQVRMRRFADWAARLRRAAREYTGTLGRRRRDEPVNDRASLRRFLETRASYVAQTSLYGYLRTRAGMIYPQLFEDDTFVRSVNVAKWHVWLACLSDLSVYAGGLLARGVHDRGSGAGAVISELVDAVLDQTGTPVDADAEFGGHAQRVRARIASCNWAAVTDDDSAFCMSPTALVRWAPVVDRLKELDEEIVKNSVRFRWQEVRRELRRNLDAAQVLRSAG